MTGNLDTRAQPADSGAEQPLRSLAGEQLELMGRQVRSAVPQALVSSVVLWVLLLQELHWRWPTVWLLSFWFVTWRHVRLLMRLPADETMSEKRRVDWAALTYTRQGLIWGALFLFFPFVSPIIRAVLTIFVVGIASAAMNATLGLRRAYLPTLFSLLLPPTICWAIFVEPGTPLYERLALPLLSAMFVVTMMRYAGGVYALFRDSYNIRQQRLELLAQLGTALERAEMANQAKTRFLASASHDLRQPIQALMLFTGELNAQPLDRRSAGIAAQIDKAANNLASELDGLLDISKLDAGAIRPAVFDLDLERLLLDLQEEFRPQAELKGLGFEFACPPRAAGRSDPLLLQRILRNLLSNALKYTDRGTIGLIATLQAGQVHVAVTDTGHGIPAEEHERVFEEFYQLGNPERDRARGLGLGLSIVRRLADLLRIELELVSEPGKGSRFSLRLPPTSGAAVPPTAGHAVPDTAAATADPTSAPAQKRRVLVVDDEEAIRLGMLHLLQRSGYAARTASSTDEAVAIVREWTPDLLLADFRLRGTDSGIRTIVESRRFVPELPALLISGETAPERLVEAREAGLLLLPKPLPPADLLQAVSHAMRP